MELAKLDNNLPLKAYPEAELNRIILTQFTIWVSSLLSLTDETAMNRLEVALPSIKEHCWSMGFSEIKKMLEMYADSKLSVKPMSNFFDRVTFGKIVEAYKEQKVVPKKQIVDSISEEEKKSLIKSGINKCLTYYEQEYLILEDYILFMYDILTQDKHVDLSPKEKKEYYNAAKEFLTYDMHSNKPTNLNQRTKYKELVVELQKKHSSVIVLKAKEMVVMDFLRNIYKSAESVNAFKANYE